jgi:hypothetical protein
MNKKEILKKALDATYQFNLSHEGIYREECVPGDDKPRFCTMGFVMIGMGKDPMSGSFTFDNDDKEPDGFKHTFLDLKAALDEIVGKSVFYWNDEEKPSIEDVRRVFNKELEILDAKDQEQA